MAIVLRTWVGDRLAWGLFLFYRGCCTQMLLECWPVSADIVVRVLRAWVGGRLAWSLFLFYLATLGFYLYVRLTSTLDLGLHYQWCACLAPQQSFARQAVWRACHVLHCVVAWSIVMSAVQ